MAPKKYVFNKARLLHLVSPTPDIPPLLTNSPPFLPRLPPWTATIANGFGASFRHAPRALSEESYADYAREYCNLAGIFTCCAVMPVNTLCASTQASSGSVGGRQPSAPSTMSRNCLALSSPL